MSMYREPLPRLPHPQAAEVAKIYWLTNLPVKQVAKMFGIKREAHVWRIAGPNQVGNHCCKDCGKPIEACSRMELKERTKKIADFVEPHKGAAWSHPLLCRACALELSDQDNEAFLEEREGRNRRNLELRSMSIREFKRTPEWQRVHDRAMEWADYRCQLCNSGSLDLQVELRSMDGVPSPEPAETTVICGDCALLLDRLPSDKGTL